MEQISQEKFSALDILAVDAVISRDEKGAERPTPDENIHHVPSVPALSGTFRFIHEDDETEDREDLSISMSRLSGILFPGDFEPKVNDKVVIAEPSFSGKIDAIDKIIFGGVIALFEIVLVV